MIEKLHKLNNGIARVETWILITIVLFLVVVAFGQVMLRNVFHYSIDGADIILRHLVLWIAFIGASLATRDEKHITIDVLSRLTRKRGQKVMKAVTLLFSIGISLILAKAGYDFVKDEMIYKTLLFGSVKAWYFEAIIPLGFLFIGTRFMLNLVFMLFQKEGEV